MGSSLNCLERWLSWFNFSIIFMWWRPRRGHVCVLHHSRCLNPSWLTPFPRTLLPARSAGRMVSLSPCRSHGGGWSGSLPIHSFTFPEGPSLLSLVVFRTQYVVRPLYSSKDSAAIMYQETRSSDVSALFLGPLGNGCWGRVIVALTRERSYGGYSLYLAYGR